MGWVFIYALVLAVAVPLGVGPTVAVAILCGAPTIFILICRQRRS